MGLKANFTALLFWCELDGWTCLLWCKFGHCAYPWLCPNTSLRGVYSLTLKITFAYLTYDDVQRIPSLKEQTVIVIKAPAETKLEVPHPEEVHFLVNYIFLCKETKYYDLKS